MKKILFFFVFLSFLSSCSNDDDSLATSRSKATFKIGSVEKSFTEANSFNNGILTLGNTADELVVLFFPIPSTFPTTYNMATEDLITASYVVDGKTYNATNGVLGIGAKGSFTIKITDYSNSKISGSFQFTSITDNNEEIIITQGVFENIPNL